MRAKNCCSLSLCYSAQLPFYGGKTAHDSVRLWSLMLMVQTVPYAAAGLLSVISTTPNLPGRLVLRARNSLTHPSA